MTRRSLAALAWLCCIGPAVRAQEPAPPSLRALRTDRAMRLDGVPDEDVWLDADSITDFRQRDPREGEPATLRTVVRIVAADAGLYVAFWAYDPEPSQLRRAQLRRDANQGTDDRVAILLDPQRDRRSGYYFVVNPNGARQDFEISGGDDNGNWDGIWDARAHITGFGWTAELFLPWQMFRYPPSDGAQWGMNVGRVMRRQNEEALWRGWLRQQGFIFQEAEGTLEIPGRLPHRQPLELRPYLSGVIAASSRSYDASGADSAVIPGADSLRGGVDAKFAVAPTLTLDLSVNTDFAQVEVDRQVVNLSRFPVFFEEKRGFFLESAGNFEFGQNRRTQVFNSRRIGLDSSGATVPILAGLRLSGRAGHERVGVLAVRTGGAEDAFDGVVRIKHDVLSRGYVGAIATVRDGPGVAQRQLAGGVDFSAPLLWHGQNVVPSAFVAWTQTGSGAPVASAWRLFLDYPNNSADHFLAFNRIAAGFDPALGFVRQSGVYRGTGQLSFYPRPHLKGVRRLNVKLMEFDISTDLNGVLDNASYEVRPIGAEFQSGDVFEVNLQRYADAPRDSFELFAGVTLAPRRYDFNRVEVHFNSTSARPAGLQTVLSAGQYYDGHGTEFEYQVNVRVAPHLLVGVDGFMQWVSLPAGRFTAQAHRVRLDYAATPRFNSTLFVQWDNESERLAVNGRLRWSPSPGTDAFLVWNSGWPTQLSGGVPWSRPLRQALIAKYVHYFRV